MTSWEVCRPSDRRALDLVDGTGPWLGYGPHYSRRAPGSMTFTGAGRQVVLVRPDAVWAVIRNRLRQAPDSKPAPTRYVWRCSMFRNLGPDRSSDLIRQAVAATAREWARRYGDVPGEDLTTEVNTRKVHSEIAGYCYRRAGWVKTEQRRGLVILRCPRPQIIKALST